MKTNREEGKKDNTHEKKDAIYLNMFNNITIRDSYRSGLGSAPQWSLV